MKIIKKKKAFVGTVLNIGAKAFKAVNDNIKAHNQRIADEAEVRRIDKINHNNYLLDNASAYNDYINRNNVLDEEILRDKFSLKCGGTKKIKRAKLGKFKSRY